MVKHPRGQQWPKVITMLDLEGQGRGWPLVRPGAKEEGAPQRSWSQRKVATVRPRVAMQEGVGRMEATSPSTCLPSSFWYHQLKTTGQGQRTDAVVSLWGPREIREQQITTPARGSRGAERANRG